MTKIPFADVRFPPLGHINGYDVEARLKTFLQAYRKKNSPNKEHWVLSDDDWDKIIRRAKAYIESRGRSSKMGHLDRDDREKLAMFRDGIELKAICSEHQADEIASELHTEMPWMAQANERVWKELRASARKGDPGVRLTPMLLIGPPGIGKSHWAQLLGQYLSVPTTVVEATNEPASFSITGTQRGWSNQQPGRLLQTILDSTVGNPVIVVDEIEKAGRVTASRGTPFDLVDGLLPLLERSTAKNWSCPYFRVSFDMSWVSWVMTANTTEGLSRPFLSRCPPLQLTALSLPHLREFAAREGQRRDLPEDAIGAVLEVIDAIRKPQLLSLRNVIRLLNEVEQKLNQPRHH